MPKSRDIPVRADLPFDFVIRACSFRQYRTLADFHYRAGSPGPVYRTFGLYGPACTSRIDPRDHPVGIIVYSMPPLNHQLRNIATDFRYAGLADVAARAHLINREIRTISRVIIHPQFRSLGLAAELVKLTMPVVGTLFIEASAVMGLFHPFFVKAGMRMFTAPNDLKRELLLAAFQYVGVAPEQLLDTKSVLAAIRSLKPCQRKFLLRQIDRYFLQARRSAFSSNIPNDLDWILPRLAYCVLQRPAYFLWQNGDLSPDR